MSDVETKDPVEMPMELQLWLRADGFRPMSGFPKTWTRDHLGALGIFRMEITAVEGGLFDFSARVDVAGEEQPRTARARIDADELGSAVARILKA